MEETNKTDSVVEETKTTTPAASNTKMILVVVILIALLAGGGYWLMQKDQERVAEIDYIIEQSIEETNNMPEVVATINGVEIKRDLLQENIEYLYGMVMQQGVDVTDPVVEAEIKQQALTQAINNELLAQAAADAGIVTADEAVVTEMNNLRAQFPDEATFAAELEAAGVTVEQLEDSIKKQLAIDEYIANSEAFAAIPEVTDEEAQAYYDQLLADGNELPEYAEISEMIKADLAQEGEQAAFEGIINTLRAEADIEVNI